MCDTRGRTHEPCGAERGLGVSPYPATLGSGSDEHGGCRSDQQGNNGGPAPDLRGMRRRPFIMRLCGAGADDGQMSLRMYTAAERPDLWERGIESAMA